MRHVRHGQILRHGKRLGRTVLHTVAAGRAAIGIGPGNENDFVLDRLLDRGIVLDRFVAQGRNREILDHRQVADVAVVTPAAAMRPVCSKAASLAP